MKQDKDSGERIVSGLRHIPTIKEPIPDGRMLYVTCGDRSGFLVVGNGACWLHAPSGVLMRRSDDGGQKWSTDPKVPPAQQAERRWCRIKRALGWAA